MFIFTLFCHRSNRAHSSEGCLPCFGQFVCPLRLVWPLHGAVLGPARGDMKGEDTLSQKKVNLQTIAQGSSCETLVQADGAAHVGERRERKPGKCARIQDLDIQVQITFVPFPFSFISSFLHQQYFIKAVKNTSRRHRRHNISRLTG